MQKKKKTPQLYGDFHTDMTVEIVSGIECVVNMLSALCDVWELTRFTGTLICMNNCPLKRWWE